jgi:5-methylthioadenosine/S-adenosylhomocysteine deaminase
VTDKLVRGGHVIFDPARLPAGGRLSHGAVVLDEGKVVAVDDYDVLKARHPDAEEIGSDDHVVMPGLINTHHHGTGLSMFQLGTGDDYLEPWLLDWFCTKPLDAYLDTLYACMKLIRSGVTTVLHAAYSRDWKLFEPETRASLAAYEAAGVRTAFALHTVDQNFFVYQDTDEFLASLPTKLSTRVRDVVAETAPPTADDFFTLFEQLHEEYSAHALIKIMICPVGPQWCSDGLLRKLRKTADEHETGLHLHCLETPYQREFGLQSYGKSTVEHLYELGILGPDVSLAHAIWFTDRDIDICAETGTSVCHNASSNLRLRSGIMPAPLMLEKGVNVSIGIDGMALNDDDDMLQELRLVSKIHRLPQGFQRPRPLTSAEIFKMATVNGAQSTTIGPRIGTLVPGSEADIVLIDYTRIAQPYLHSGTDVADAVLHRGKGSDVDTVLVGGEVILRDGEFPRLREDELLKELAAIAEAEPEPRVRRWMEAMSELRPHVDRFYQGWETPEYDPCYTVNSSI